MKNIIKNKFINYSSIKQDIFRSSIILSCAFLFLFGSSLSLILYESGMLSARNVIKQRNYAVSYFIDAYFSEIKDVVDILMDNEVANAMSNDRSIDLIMQQLADHEETEQYSYSYVINPQGKIILHHDPEHLDKNISEIITENPLFNKNEGFVEYQFNDENILAYYSHTHKADWIVVTVVKKSDIIGSIVYKISAYLLLVFIVSMLFAFAQSTLLSNRFSTPLIQLQRKVKAVVQGNWEESKKAQPYPKNEIGMISQEIEKLTTDGLYSKSRELKLLNDLLEKKAATDQLTGLHNRRKIDEELANLYHRLTRYNNPFSVILLDIDWFKSVNDTYGHQLGDTTLKELANILQQSVRYIDTVGRWGGEEFIILCPETHFGDGKSLAERIRSSVENSEFTIHTKVTVSIGVAECSRSESVDSLIYRVDKNLYTAKENGRNTVV